jgi:hypothetical protein
MKSAGPLFGCATEETGDKLVLIVNPMTILGNDIAKKDIQSRVLSKHHGKPAGAAFAAKR